MDSSFFGNSSLCLALRSAACHDVCGPIFFVWKPLQSFPPQLPVIYLPSSISQVCRIFLGGYVVPSNPWMLLYFHRLYSHKLYHLLLPRKQSSYNLRRQKLYNLSRSHTERFRRSFVYAMSQGYAQSSSLKFQRSRLYCKIFIHIFSFTTQGIYIHMIVISFIF